MKSLLLEFSVIGAILALILVPVHRHTRLNVAASANANLQGSDSEVVSAIEIGGNFYTLRANGDIRDSSGGLTIAGTTYIENPPSALFHPTRVGAAISQYPGASPVQGPRKVAISFIKGSSDNFIYVVFKDGHIAAPSGAGLPFNQTTNAVVATYYLNSGSPGAAVPCPPGSTMSWVGGAGQSYDPGIKQNYPSATYIYFSDPNNPKTNPSGYEVAQCNAPNDIP